jgi:hypothetical protein
MFVVRKEWIVRWPVRVHVPGQDEPSEFTAIFNLPDTNRISAAVGDNADVEILKEAWVGWDEIVDGNGRPIVFKTKDRDNLLAATFVRRAVGKALLECLVGEPAASKGAGGQKKA